MEEFHAFFKLNMFVEKFKERHPQFEVLVGLPTNACGIVTETDLTYYQAEEWFREQGAAYPEVLNDLGDRNKSTFYQVLDELPAEARLVYTNEQIVSRQNVSGVRLEFPWYNVADLTASFKRDFAWIADWLRRGKRLGPKVYQREPRTVAICTRNFANKQPETNTHVLYPQLQELVDRLVWEGLFVVNIGVPPSRLREQEFYSEVELSSYASVLHELASAQAFLIFGDNGGYAMQLAAIGRPILLTEEWTYNHHEVRVSLAEVRGVPKMLSEFANCKWDPIIEAIYAA